MGIEIGPPKKERRREFLKFTDGVRYERAEGLVQVIVSRVTRNLELLRKKVRERLG